MSSGHAFPTTRWTLILDLREEGPESQRARALEELCQLYWYPIYAHVRQRGRSPEDAEDLTQAFFAGMVENHSFERAEQSRGRLRSFLLGSLNRFLSGQRRRESAGKRGGGAVMLSLDQAFSREEGESRYRLEAVDEFDPETLFLRRWASTLIESVQESLRREYVARGHEELFDRLQPYLFGNRGEARFGVPAEALGMSVEAVRTAVKRLRQRFREALRDQIRFTVEDDAEIDAEIRTLFAAFGAGRGPA